MTHPGLRVEKCQLSQRVMLATLVQEASQPECSVSLQACPEIPHAKVGKPHQLSVLERQVSGLCSLHEFEKLCHATEIVLLQCPESAERHQTACVEGKTMEKSVQGGVHEAGGHVSGANQSQVRQLVDVPGRCCRENGGRSGAAAREVCENTRASALPGGRLMIVRQARARLAFWSDSCPSQCILFVRHGACSVAERSRRARRDCNPKKPALFELSKKNRKEPNRRS